FSDDDVYNPLKAMANQFLHADSAQRASAFDGLISAPIDLVTEPGLQQDLKDLRALINKVPVDDTTDPPTYRFTPALQQQFDALTNKISQQLRGDQGGLWEAMGV